MCRHAPRPLRRPVHRAVALFLALVPLGCGRSGPNPPGGNTPAADALGSVDVGATEKVFYRGDTRPRAEHLGRLLTGVGYFNGRSSSAAEIRREGNGWAVRILLGGPGWAEPGFQALWRNWYGPLIAAQVFPGEAVEFLLCDDRAEPQLRIPIPPSGAVATDQNRFVLYHEPHRDRAERLAAGLTAMGPQGPPRWSFLVARDAAGWVLTFPLGANEMQPAQDRMFREMRADFARSPFDGGPLKLVVLDARMQPRWTFND